MDRGICGVGCERAWWEGGWYYPGIQPITYPVVTIPSSTVGPLAPYSVHLAGRTEDITEYNWSGCASVVLRQSVFLPRSFPTLNSPLLNISYHNLRKKFPSSSFSSPRATDYICTKLISPPILHDKTRPSCLVLCKSQKAQLECTPPPRPKSLLPSRPMTSIPAPSFSYREFAMVLHGVAWC